MQINTEKTKMMAFFETPATLRLRGGRHQPSPSLPPFHIYAPYPGPLLHPRSLLIREVYQFEYLGLLLDPKLSMHLAALNAITKAAKGHALNQSVSYSI